MVEIREIQPTKRNLLKFVHFPIDVIYRDSKYYIPPLVTDEVNTLRPDKNPAFDFCEAAYFLAYRDGKIVGRIAGIINHVVNDSVNDSVRVLRAFNQVRFYRSDVQGICDSLQLSEADTIINMYRHAVVWNKERQIFGDEINVHLNDSAADWATLPTGGLMAEHLGEIYYDQLSGKKMKAWFEEKELRRLDVDGNVQVIMFPQEIDSTYNKMVNAESSYMRLNLKPKQEVDRITMWPEVTGKVIPLYLAKRSQLYLPQFNWYDTYRPKDPDDIYDVDGATRQLMSSPVDNPRRLSEQ